MTVLHSVDFFPSGKAPVAIEPRLPQAAFPEHHHDFHEIVIVEHGTGIHVFNGQPYTISGGTVCFVRDHDRHLYEHTDNLCLTNVLWRSPDAFSSGGVGSIAAAGAGWLLSFALAGESECVAAGAPVGRSDGAHRRRHGCACRGESRNFVYATTGVVTPQ